MFSSTFGRDFNGKSGRVREGDECPTREKGEMRALGPAGALRSAALSITIWNGLPVFD